MFLEKADKEPDDDDGYEERDDPADRQHRGVVFRKGLGVFLVQVPKGFDGSAKHCRHGEEKGKFGRRAPRERLAQTADDGCAAPAETRQHDRKHLEAADLECGRIRNIAFRLDPRMIEPAVDEEENDPAANHDIGYKIEVIEFGIDPFLQQKTENDRGDHRNDQLQIKAEPRKVEEFPVIDDHDSEYRKELDDDLKHIRKGRIVYANDRVGEFHVRSGTDGQEFGQTFHDRQDDCLNYRHMA